MELKNEIDKIIRDIKLPQGIRITIKKQYEEYREAYKSLIKLLKIQYPNKEKELSNIEEALLQDYKENIEMTELLEIEEYEQKRMILIETIKEKLKQNNNDVQLLMRRFEEEVSNVIKKEGSIEFANIVIRNVVEEIRSSSKCALNRINYLKLQENEETQQAKEEFKQEILRIEQETIAKAPEIAQCLNQHFITICKKVDDIMISTEKKEHMEDDER